MARPAKTETLTIRLDPKTRFILDFLSRYHGQTITTVVERAVAKAASDVDLAGEFDARVGWQELWDTSEAVRSIAVARQPKLFPTYDEERRLAFLDEHWEFFFTSSGKETAKRYSLDLLWPRLDEFIAMHERERAKDYWAAGKAMAEALRTAGLAAPEWPKPPAKPRPSKGPTESFSADLDDEIPF